jgi:hypothetical protein
MWSYLDTAFVEQARAKQMLRARRDRAGRWSCPCGRCVRRFLATIEA